MLDPELVSVKFGCSFEIVCIHRNLPITDRPKLIVSVMWFFLVELCIFNELMRKKLRRLPEQGEFAGNRPNWLRLAQGSGTRVSRRLSNSSCQTS